MEGNNQAPILTDIENYRENPYIALASLIRNEFESLPPLSSDCCIYRVPQQLRCVNEKAYTPQIVSIGPLHHGREGLEAMEKHKRRYLRKFLLRTNVRLEEYVEKIKDEEERLRNCYAVEDIKFTSDEFVTIILVDAAFIVELLLRFAPFRFNESENQEEDRIVNKPWMVHSVAPDLQLLENQLPFFILEYLLDTYRSTLYSNGNNTPETERRLSIISLSYTFFKITMGLEGADENLKTISTSSCRVEHFVDLLRSLRVPLNMEGKSETSGGPFKTLTTPTMTRLHQSGVKLKVGSTKNLFDMHFIDGGILEIPKLIIHDYTEVTLRNLLAFEQCHCHKHYISNYVSILDDLVNTPRDVELLVKYGIVEHMLGDNAEVSTLINKLGKGVAVTVGQDFYYADLCEKLNKYCRKRWNNWKASLRQNYFNTPWATISVIAAVLLITLTLIQTVFTVMPDIPA